MIGLIFDIFRLIFGVVGAIVGAILENWFLILVVVLVWNMVIDEENPIPDIDEGMMRVERIGCPAGEAEPCTVDEAATYTVIINAADQERLKTVKYIKMADE